MVPARLPGLPLTTGPTSGQAQLLQLLYKGLTCILWPSIRASQPGSTTPMPAGHLTYNNQPEAQGSPEPARPKRGARTPAAKTRAPRAPAGQSRQDRQDTRQRCRLISNRDSARRTRQKQKDGLLHMQQQVCRSVFLHSLMLPTSDWLLACMPCQCMV